MKNKKKQKYRPDHEEKWKKIMKKYGGTVKSTIYKTYSGPLSQDFLKDLISNAWLRIIKNYKKFDPRKGSLGLFIKINTKNATIEYLRKNDPLAPHKQFLTISIEKIYHEDEDEGDFNNIHKDDILEVMSTIDEILDDFEKISFLETCLETLTPIEKDVMTLKIKFNASYKDIAFQFDTSEASVRSAFNRGKEKLLLEVNKQIGNLL